MLLPGNTISPIYRGKFLDELHRAATLACGTAFDNGRLSAYGHFYRTSINQVDDYFDCSYLSAGVVNWGMGLLPGIKAENRTIVGLNRNDLRKSYFELHEHDPFTKRLDVDNGRALFIDSLAPMEELRQTVIYEKHHRRFDIDRLVAVSFELPYEYRRKFTFIYFRSSGDFEPEVVELYVEYVTFPFYLGWLCAYGYVAPEVLREWLTLLEDCWLDEFRVLRALRWPDATAKLIQQRLGLSNKRYDKILSRTSGKLRQHISFEDNGGTYFPKTHALTTSYDFLKFGRISPVRKNPLRRRWQ